MEQELEEGKSSLSGLDAHLSLLKVHDFQTQTWVYCTPASFCAFSDLEAVVTHMPHLPVCCLQSVESKAQEHSTPWGIRKVL